MVSTSLPLSPFADATITCVEVVTTVVVIAVVAVVVVGIVVVVVVVMVVVVAVVGALQESVLNAGVMSEMSVNFTAPQPSSTTAQLPVCSLKNAVELNL